MFDEIIEDITMAVSLNEREYQSYRSYKTKMAIIMLVIFLVLILSIASFNDDTLVRPKIEKELIKNNYVVELTHSEGKNNLNCISEETGGMVIVAFINNGNICNISYALPVEDAYMTDTNIRKFENHINDAFMLISKHKGKLKKTEKYPAYPISDECFEEYPENIKNSYQKKNAVDGYEFSYEYLGDNGDNAMFYYYTELKD